MHRVLMKLFPDFRKTINISVNTSIQDHTRSIIFSISGALIQNTLSVQIIKERFEVQSDTVGFSPVLSNEFGEENETVNLTEFQALCLPTVFSPRTLLWLPYFILTPSQIGKMISKKFHFCELFTPEAFRSRNFYKIVI